MVVVTVERGVTVHFTEMPLLESEQIGYASLERFWDLLRVVLVCNRWLAGAHCLYVI